MQSRSDTQDQATRDSLADDTEAAARVGELVGGRFRLQSVLGRGASGTVYLATDPASGGPVALKLLDARSRSPIMRKRFMREARMAARIASPHVARVIEANAPPGGDPYIVMEYLEGRDLRRVLREAGGVPLPIADVVDWSMEALEGIFAAHALGIVHRDLKPGNLFLARDRDGPGASVKVLDFGVSKLVESTETTLTGTADIVGSPAYISPEQFNASRNVDGRADIWSMGVILYELLTGSRPFGGGQTLAHTIAAVLTADPSPPATLRPDLPRGLEEIVLRCLAKDPGRRFAGVADLATPLAEFGSSRSRDCLAMMGRDHPVPLGAVTSATSPGGGGLGWKRFAGALVVVGAAGAAAALTLAWPRSSTPPTRDEAADVPARAAPTANAASASAGAGALLTEEPPSETSASAPTVDASSTGTSTRASRPPRPPRPPHPPHVGVSAAKPGGTVGASASAPPDFGGRH